MRTPSAIVALILTIVPVCASSQQHRPPAVNRDLDFERRGIGNVPLAWEVSPGLPGIRDSNYVAILDSQIVLSGRYSLRLEHTGTLHTNDAGHAIIYLPVEAVRGKTLHLSGYIKTENVVPGYAMLVCSASDTEEAYAQNVLGIEEADSTREWTKYEISLSVSDTVERVIVGVGLRGGGRAWFDNIQVTLDGVPFERDIAPPLPFACGTAPDSLDAGQRAWLHQNAARISSIEPDTGTTYVPGKFRDLLPMREAVGSAHVVGIGEPYHGFHEFKVMLHRMIEFLVLDMGFTAIVTTSSQLETEPVNAYVLGGEGDPRKLVHEMVCGRDDEVTSSLDDSETVALVQWLRRYNRAVDLSKRVRFFGCNATFMASAGDSIFEYVKLTDSTLKYPLDTIMQGIDYIRAMNLRELTRGKVHTRNKYDALVDTKVKYLKETVADLTHRYHGVVSDAQEASVMHCADIFEQASRLATPSMVSEHYPDSILAANFNWIRAQRPAGTKYIVFAHNDQIARHPGTMGSYMSKSLGTEYRPMAGCVYSMSMKARNDYGLLNSAVYEAYPRTPEHVFHTLKMPAFFLDLRRSAAHDPSSSWLRGAVSYRAGQRGLDTTDGPMVNKYDCIYFVDEIFRAQQLGHEAPPTSPTVVNRDLDFERRGNGDRPLSWDVTVGIPGFYTPQYNVALDSHTVFTGRYSLHMENTGTHDRRDIAAATIEIPVESIRGRTLHLTGFLKVANVNDGFAALSCSAGSGLFGSMARNSRGDWGAKGTADWTRYEMEGRVADTATHCEVRASFSGTGEAWFDHLEVFIDGAPYTADLPGAYHQAYDTAPDVLSPEQRMWLMNTLVPIATIEPDAGVGTKSGADSDLLPLGDAIGNARVVAIGEPYHGYHEFPLMEHRMIEFLVRNMGFTALIMESNQLETEPVNNFVLGGEGDARQLVHAMVCGRDTGGTSRRDDSETVSLIQWIRSYNQTVESSKRVHIGGCDAHFLELAGDSIREFVGRVNVSEKNAISRQLAMIGALRDSIRSSVAEYSGENPESRAMDTVIVRLVRSFKANVEQIAKRHGGSMPKARIDFIVHCAEIIEQVVIASNESFRPKHFRDSIMAANVNWLRGRLSSDTRCIVLAHNGHIARLKGRMGSFLAQSLHDAYRPIAGFVYSVIPGTADNSFMQVPKLYDAIPKTPEWQFNSLKTPAFFLDLRRTSSTITPSAWLRTAISFHDGQLSANGTDSTIVAKYDGFYFVDRATPAHRIEGR